MQNFICFTVIDGAGEYKKVSFDIDSLIEKYGAESTMASVPELFPIIGYDEGDDSITVDEVEALYPPDGDEDIALTALGDLAEQLDLEVGEAISIGNCEEVFFLIPID